MGLHSCLGDNCRASSRHHSTSKESCPELSDNSSWQSPVCHSWRSLTASWLLGFTTRELRSREGRAAGLIEGPGPVPVIWGAAGEVSTTTGKAKRSRAIFQSCYWSIRSTLGSIRSIRSTKEKEKCKPLPALVKLSDQQPLMEQLHLSFLQLDQFTQHESLIN